MDWHEVELRAVEGSMLGFAGLALYCFVFIYDVLGLVSEEGEILIIFLHFLDLFKERLII